MDAILEYLSIVSNNIVRSFINPNSFLSFWPLFLAGLLAFSVILWRLRQKSNWRGHKTSRKLKTLRRTLLPKWLLTHPSSRMDVRIFVINHALIFFSLFAAILTPFIFAESFTTLMGSTGLAETKQTAAWGERLAFTIIMVLAWDFAATYAHYLKHRIPMFWEFHKVHHSADVMTPLTAMRRHPMETVLSVLVTGTVIGGAIAAWHLIVGHGVETLTIFGALSGIYAWRLLGYNLRHSHIWVSYGQIWNRILISPAQHQIHHSRDPKHHDTNFGHIFSFWDALLGTLYLPEETERVTFGIDTDDADDFKTLQGVYLSPFVKSWAMLTRKFKWISNTAGR